MSHYSPPIPCLVSFDNPEDVGRIDKAIDQNTLGFERLGSKTYLAFLFEPPSVFYSKLKTQHKLVGSAHWILLPQAEETK